VSALDCRPTLVAGPATEPITRAQAKTHCHVTTADEDDGMDLIIAAARGRCEQETQRALITQTWDLTFDAFPCEIDVPSPPLLTVTSINYVDTAGETQLLASSRYQVDAPVGPHCARGRIRPAYGMVWPSTRDQMNAVTIRITAGYGATRVTVPAALRQGMLIDVGTLFEFRQDLIDGTAIEIPLYAKRIFRRFRSYPRRTGEASA
jgi:uncharacterized phiE125 gp8 family phage protein